MIIWTVIAVCCKYHQVYILIASHYSGPGSSIICGLKNSASTPNNKTCAVLIKPGSTDLIIVRDLGQTPAFPSVVCFHNPGSKSTHSKTVILVNKAYLPEVHQLPYFFIKLGCLRFPGPAIIPGCKYGSVLPDYPSFVTYKSYIPVK